MKNKKTIAICFIILFAGAFFAWLFIATKPQNDRIKPPVISPIVSCIPAEIEQAQMKIYALGTVQAAQETLVRAQVSAQVKTLGENSEVGALVNEGEILTTLDSTTYKHILNSKKSALDKAKADYEIEMGQQKVAKAEAEQLKKMSSTSSNNIDISKLTLRSPYLTLAKANIDTATSEMALAQFDFDNTAIKAPYNALILERNISIGSYASESTQLFRLVGTDEYYIEASIALDKLQALNLNKLSGAKANIISGAGIEREGTILHAIASLNNSARMGRILISIPDPLGLESNTPSLILGDQAKIEFVAGTLNNTIVLPRASLQGNDKVWVAVPHTIENTQTHVLNIRSVEVAWKDSQKIYISSGIESNELVITSPIPSPIQGMQLQIK